MFLWRGGYNLTFARGKPVVPKPNTVFRIISTDGFLQTLEEIGRIKKKKAARKQKAGQRGRRETGNSFLSNDCKGLTKIFLQLLNEVIFGIKE